VISAWISLLARTLSILLFSTLMIFPRSGRTAWVFRPALQPALGRGYRVRCPRALLRLLARPGLKPWLELGKIKEEVLRLSRNRSVAADLALRVDQLKRIEQLAAVVALVAPGVGEVAVRALALDEAVCEEALVSLAVGLLHLALKDVAVGVEVAEDILGDLDMVLSRGAAEDIEADAEPLVDLLVHGVVLVAQLARGQSLFERLGLGRCAVLVSAADIEDPVPLAAVVARKDVGR
jgi:hypothetical protein